MESSYINADGTVPGQTVKRETYTHIMPHFGPAYAVEVWTGAGGHGGGDERLLDDIFGANPPADKYKHAADQRAGAYSILTGVAANHSMATNKLIYIDDLVHGLEMPDYPPMPSADEPLSFDEVAPLDLPPDLG